jgi:hypothetical protein
MDFGKVGKRLLKIKIHLTHKTKITPNKEFKKF